MSQHGDFEENDGADEPRGEARPLVGGASSAGPAAVRGMGDRLWGSRLRLGAVSVALVALLALAAVVSSRSGSSSSPSSSSSHRNSKKMLDAAARHASAAKLEETSSSASSVKPNIILFTVDDLGWNDVGYTSTDIKFASPYMKKLASEGVKLTRYYTQPSCSPSRSTIMSGKFVHKTGYQNLEIQHDYTIGMPLSMKLLPEHMKEQGYRTYGFGKWNIGHCNTKYLPHERGFNYFLGYNCPGHGYRTFNCGFDSKVRDMFRAVKDVDEAGQPVVSWENPTELHGTYDTEIYRDESVKFVKEHVQSHTGKPFFMWVAHHGVHGAYDSDPIPPTSLLRETNLKAIKKVEKEQKDHEFWPKRKLTAMALMAVDNALRDLMRTVDEQGLTDSTFLLVNSDNGGDPDYSMGHPGNNWPLRGEKFFYFEGGIRVPAFIYAPGIIPSSLAGSEYHGLVHHVDLLTTFVALAGGDALAEDEYLDGVDFLPSLLAGEDQSPRYEVVFTLPRSGKVWALSDDNTEVAVLRQGPYKIMITSIWDKCFRPAPGVTGFKSTTCSYDWNTVVGSCTWTNFLFNVDEDPTESTNLFHLDEYADIRESLISRIHELLEENPYNYGRLMHEYFVKGKQDKDVTYDAHMKAHDYWLGPWGCEVMP